MDLGGVWCAYYLDMSNVVPCASELEALRIAVGSSALVGFVPYGMGLQEFMQKEFARGEVDKCTTKPASATTATAEIPAAPESPTEGRASA